MSLEEDVICPSCKSPGERSGVTESLARYECLSCGHVWWEAEDTIYKNEFFNEVMDFFQQELDSAKKGKVRNYTEDDARKFLEIARGRDLDMLSSEWEYLVKTEDGNYYWTNKKDDFARVI